ncbi:MAG: hypothetical protein HC889_16560, partial [Synechococcaceae cyanobacterium SM1_2_3]|nr:hypothetical protein [Synechococcaceae cyanobacterium SM1_2_3]
MVSWIGHADLKAAAGEAGAGLGPIAQAVAFKDFAASFCSVTRRRPDATLSR